MTCPAGLSAGTGLAEAFSSSICYLRSDFGTLSDGHGLFRLGTGAIMNTDSTGTYVLTAAHNLYQRPGARGVEGRAVVRLRRPDGHGVAHQHPLSGAGRVPRPVV